MTESKRNRSHIYYADVDPKFAERGWQLAADRLVEYDLEPAEVAAELEIDESQHGF